MLGANSPSIRPVVRRKKNILRWESQEQDSKKRKEEISIQRHIHEWNQAKTIGVNYDDNKRQ